MDNYIPLTEIPQEVLDAVEKVETFFETQGMRGWQFRGLADRRLVTELEWKIANMEVDADD